MVIHKAAPVEQVEHGLKAEHGLLRQLGIVRDHEGTCRQLDGLVSLRPSKLLKPHLQQQPGIHSETTSFEYVQAAVQAESCSQTYSNKTYPTPHA